MTRIKICGVTRAVDAKLASKLGAWAVGMIFVPGTPRYLSLAKARRVRAGIGKNVKAVGVFRSPSRTLLIKTIKVLRLDFVQIYGPRWDKLGELPVPVIEANTKRPKNVKTEFVLVEPHRLDRTRAKKIYLKAQAQKRAWELAAQLGKGKSKVILAGGLTPENVLQAVKIAQPWAVDVSSGIERRIGIKDSARMKLFFSRFS